jgi:hypothetical protein
LFIYVIEWKDDSADLPLLEHTYSLSLFYSARGQFDIYLPAGRHDNHCYLEKPVFKLTHYQTLLTCQGDAKAIF